ncbi:cytochrome B561 [Lysobacter arseniciresistens ZS79]|uniref:Cytochrome B561 n=1 Tax=Lysobacter arseniciresistens ZS79 TaxID=913325 RepID=A0A0A0F3Q8_9GAMM|nr:cytochrome b [Lysobacter arseniciresistens]KGM57444.1 cytochrome B561 [Lysobacter arseniciresistens ZS79]
MNWKNTPERWGPVSQLLHWLIVVLLVVLSVVGLSLDSLPKTPKYFWVYDLHKSTGLTLLALVVLRIGWRLVAGAPRPLPGTAVWQARLASATHGLLYLLILAMPLSGWLYDSASGLRPLRWYGLAEVPKLSAPNEQLADFGHEAHEWLFWLLLLVVIGHVAAAFYHHIFQRDDTLRRMLPRRRRTASGGS